MDNDQFLCSWQRDDNPTKGMSDAEMRAFYKAFSVRGDCAFATRAGSETDSGMPVEIYRAWSALWFACMAAGKETAEHRAQRDSIRAAWRSWAAGQAYTLLVIPDRPETSGQARSKRRAARMTSCPHCGGSLAGAA